METSSSGENLFFGIGAGRIGSMALATVLNTEVEVTCTHEGHFRDVNSPPLKVLPSMTLQNAMAYLRPETKAVNFKALRGNLPQTASEFNTRFFGDIAYYYSPFLSDIKNTYPRSKTFIIFRDGRHFVRSAASKTGVDPTPLGWAPNEKRLDEIEQFVALGRLRPRNDDRWFEKWDREFDAFQKNCWLWSETNRLILDSIQELDQTLVKVIRFERFFHNFESEYLALREYLGVEAPISLSTQKLLRGTAINHRVVDPSMELSNWSKEMRNQFDDIAGHMMERLGYY